MQELIEGLERIRTCPKEKIFQEIYRILNQIHTMDRDQISAFMQTYEVVRFGRRDWSQDETDLLDTIRKAIIARMGSLILSHPRDDRRAIVNHFTALSDPWDLPFKKYLS